MSTKKPVSLARYMGVGNLYLIVAPLILAGGWGFFVFDGAMRRSITETNKASATIVASRLEEFFQRPKDALEGITLTLRRTDLYPRARMQEYLEELLQMYPFLNRIQVIGRDARVLWTAPRNPAMIGFSRAGESVFENVRGGSGIRWSPSYISVKQERVAVSFGEVSEEFTIICDLDLGAIGRFSNTTKSSDPSQVEVRVTDENGVFVSHQDPGHVLRRERQADFMRIKAAGDGGEARDESGNVIFSVARVSDPSWYVLVLFPSRVLTESRIGYFLGFLLIIFFSGAFGVLFSFLRIRGLRGSLKQIAEKTEKIAGGLYEELEGFGEGFTELKKVGSSFDAMVAGIRTREKILIDRERSFREILENIQLVALGIGLDGKINFANPYFLTLSGYSWNEITGTNFSRFDSPASFDLDSPFLRVACGQSAEESFECKMCMKDGNIRLIDLTVTATRDASGSLSGAIGIGADVTESKRQRGIIEVSLKEKEVLLREIHHRVKNNLQLIISLLSLQGSELKDLTAKASLGEAEARIRSISLIHEMLYASENFGNMNFSEYASMLATELLSPSGDWDTKLDLELRELNLTLTEAIPCGLILNEAITNTRKYAFPSGWQGERRVVVQTRTEAGNKAVIRIMDTGIGLPADLNPDSSSGLGFTIIRLLAGQLGGNLRIEGKTGVLIEWSFPISGQQSDSNKVL